MSFPFYKFKSELLSIGLPEVAYEEHLTEWIEEKGDTEQSLKDFHWHVYNTVLLSVAKDYSHDLSQMYLLHHRIYASMWMFLHHEEKDSTAIKRLMHKSELKRQALGGYKINVEIICGNRCNQAKEIDGKIFPLEDMLKETLLPYKKCKRIGGCNCLYGYHMVMDENDKAIDYKY